MFRLIRFTFKTIVMLKLMALAFGAGMAAAFAIQARTLYRTWGLVEAADERSFAGDELVPEADLVETRVIDIDATPEQVWPWLAQMGYGRGGWYSYPALDRPWSPAGGATGESAETVLDELQDLAEGDLVPTHPGGGFAVKVVEPNEALVLFLDDTMTREQFQELMADQAGGGDAQAEADFEMPPYQVSWAFLLEEAPGGRTRLTERLRTRIEASESQWKARPLLAMGVFVFMRSQMLGIKRRAEEAATSED